MTILPGQILAQFFWTGTGQGTITAGAAVPGWLLPGTDLNGQTVGYRIENPDTPAQSEVGQGVWNSGASTLTRAVIWANALTGLRNPSAAAISYASTNAKIVTLVALPADFGALAALATAGTAQITDDAVTNAKLANMATGTVKARSTAATGDPEDRAIGTGLTLDGTSLRADPATINHDALQNFVANKHIDHTAVAIATQHSLAGGGDISANRTLNLVNDTASPGNNKTYGTDGAGLRGWKNDPAGAGASLPTDDTTSIARDPVDGTRQMRIDVGAVATSTVRVLSMGNRDVNLAAGGTFPELAHSHDTAEIAAGAIQGDKIYATADTAAAPSGGVSTNTLSAAADYLIATNVAITSIRINNPAAKRNIAVLNSTGAAVTVANAAGTDIIGALLPNACIALLAWSGSTWTFKASIATGAVHDLLPPPITQNQILARLAAGTGAAAGISDASLTAVTPASGHQIPMWVAGVLRKGDAGLIPGVGGVPFVDVDDGADYSVTPFEVGSTGAPRNEQRRFTGNQNHLLRFTAANLVNGYYGWLIRGGTGTVTLVYNNVPINNGTTSIGLKSKVKWTFHDGEVLIDGGTNEPVDFDGVAFLDSELRDHCGTINALGNISGALSVNYELGHDVTLTLTGNASSLAITNPPTSGKSGWITFWINHGTGPFTWAHPTGVKHDGNTAPTLSAVASRRSVLTYVTLDGGSTWISFLGGKDIPL